MVESVARCSNLMSSDGIAADLGSSPSSSRSAISSRIDGLHVGGGITEENAQEWIDLGAEKVKRTEKGQILESRT